MSINKNNNYEKSKTGTVGQKENGVLIENAIAYISASVRATKEKQPEGAEASEIKDLEAKAAYNFAIENNVWIENFSSLGEPISGGGNENELYYNEKTGLLFKVNNLLNQSNSIVNFLKYILDYNLLFRASKYELVGLGGFDKDRSVPFVLPIVSQVFIANTTWATEKEIEEIMVAINFQKINSETYSNKEYIVSDLKPRNVLKDTEGNIHVIDNIIKKVNTEIMEQETRTSVVTVDAANYKFLDFSEEVIQRASISIQGEDWFSQLIAVHNKITVGQLYDKITFSDDRLVMVAYEAMAKSDIFDDKSSLREWWIVKRYFDIYLSEEVEGAEDLRHVVNSYIGYTFSKAEISDEETKVLVDKLKFLSSIVFDENYPQKFPQFVLDFIENQEAPSNEGEDNGDVIETAKPKKEAKEPKQKTVKVKVVEGFEIEEKQLQGLIDVLEIFIETAEDGEDVSEWQKQLEQAKLDLQNVA